MSFNEFSGIEISNLIKEKKVSCLEITKHFLEVCKKDFIKDKNDPSKLNALTNLLEEDAIWEAEKLDNEIASGNIPTGKLAGVPIIIKDNICTTEGTTTASSKILKDGEIPFRSPFDATVIKKIKDENLIIIGKSNMDEFAMGGSTETSYYGITRNPKDLTKVPGGSSGGSAVAVSAGFAPLALGSDTGGSIRQPAAFTGVVGLKPTYGSVSRYGLLSYGSSLDQIGPFATNIEDTKALLEIINGEDKNDSTCIGGEYFSSKPITELKIGIPKNYFMEGIDDEIKERVYETAEALSKKGAIVTEFELSLIEYAVPTYLIIACAEASSNLSRYDGVRYGYRSEDAKTIDEIFTKTRSEGFGTEVKRRIMLGTFVLSSGFFDAYYKKALKTRFLIKEAFDKALSSYDAILCPTTPTVAYDIGGQIKDPLAMYLGDIYTTSANLTGLPAISVPAGTNKDNLPIGVQIISKEMGENTLFVIGKNV